MFKNSSHCYTFKKIKYNKGLLDNAVDATYIIHLEGNGRYDDIMNQLESYHPTKEVYIIFNKGYKKCSKDDRITLPAHDLTDAFLQEIFAQGPNDTLSVDLAAQTITIDATGAFETFEINAYKKTCLLNGYDDIDYLLSMREEIAAFEAKK